MFIFCHDNLQLCTNQLLQSEHAGSEIFGQPKHQPVSICMTTNLDPHTKKFIYDDEIWQRSQCLQQEESVTTYFANALTNLGYEPIDNSAHSQGIDCRLWRRGDQQVVICLVDDIRSCSSDYHVDLPYLWNKNTTVITDNYISCPTQYRVCRLPPSFYGIYSYAPEPRVWRPAQNFTFSVNRIDTRRLRLVLELAKRVHLHKGYVNFNAQVDTNGLATSSEQLVSNFNNSWQDLTAQEQEAWSASFKLLVPQIPLQNHELVHDDIYTRSYVNIECETYSSDNSVAFSEKIFRLLASPAPWTAYMGRYGVAYLETLGFDCMHDLVDHNQYDRLKEVENKNNIFVWASLQTANAMRTANYETVKERCSIAADHNQALLAQYKQQWPLDFGKWQQQHMNQLA